MKPSIVILACAFCFFAISLSSSQADPPKSNLDTNVPRDPPEGGFDKVPATHYYPPMLAPLILGADTVGGRVRFTFGGNDANRTEYRISWSRPGKAEVFATIAYRPGKLEQYIIDEKAPWDTVYTFKVMAYGKADGIHNVYSNWVQRTFRTPPSPLLSDKAKLNATIGALKPLSGMDKVKATQHPNPLSNPFVDTPIQLIPQPIVGKSVLPKTIKNPN
jgi:hypothetical protein